MSLDLYIKSNTPVKHRGTGVFIREDGQSKELSLERCKLMFPDHDLEEVEYEDNNFWHGNITHNLGKMARAVIVKDNNKLRHSLYQLLWEPENTGLLDNKQHLKYDYVDCINKALKVLRATPEAFKKYNPKNGWGSYSQLVSLVDSLVKTIGNLPVAYYDNYTVEASV